uniref:non-specific serine/threonine protein kinase n=1 Tax=Oryza punctata TaxID=4537 RepID=A0A0E0MGG5_ORYPU
MTWQFSGEIPSTIGECQLLQYLFLQNNSLNGNIPITLTQLKGLDTLDLSGEFDSQDGESTSLVAVKIVTICSSIDTEGMISKAIVYDFMPNGNLEDWLHPETNDQADERHLNLHQRVTILLDVACALDYLHFHGPEPIVHCDIKPSNVLLDADMVAHVGDFGLARILVEGSPLMQRLTSSMGIRGRIGYAAPEYGVGNTATTHGDIYSYGILVLETVTGKRPADSTIRSGHGLHGRLMDIVDRKLVLDFEKWLQARDVSPCSRISEFLVSLLRLGLSCSQELPSSRMQAGDVINELCAIKESLWSLDVIRHVKK